MPCRTSWIRRQECRTDGSCELWAMPCLMSGAVHPERPDTHLHSCVCKMNTAPILVMLRLLAKQASVHSIQGRYMCGTSALTLVLSKPSRTTFIAEADPYCCHGCLDGLVRAQHQHCTARRHIMHHGLGRDRRRPCGRAPGHDHAARCQRCSWCRNPAARSVHRAHGPVGVSAVQQVTAGSSAPQAPCPAPAAAPDPPVASHFDEHCNANSEAACTAPSDSKTFAILGACLQVLSSC